MRDAIWAEALKARRSRLPWLTGTAFGIAVAVGALFMFILQDPARARAIGLLGAKAQLAGGTADWPSYFALLAQITAVGGMLIFGVILIWTFGREFSDRTVKDLLALPTPRAQIVAAKFTVTASWCALLVIETFLLGLIGGALLRLPGWTASVAFAGLVRLAAAAAMTWLLLSVLALAASTGRGYLAAVGVMFVLVFMAQIVAALGYGHVFPWSVPGIYSGLAGPDRAAVGPVGLIAVIAVGVAGMAGTVAWWRHADQSR